MNIKELAKQAGFFPADDYDHANWHAAGFSKDFEHFAELVAAAASAKEREACAKLCDDVGYTHDVPQGSELAFDLAAAIRARGEKK